MIGEQIGNFKLISVLGQGGMGEVWLGEHATIGTKVAIKMLLPHISANKEHVERFFNEAIAVGKISHAGIVKIFDVGFHGGRAYLVMEFMSGESLAARIRRLGRLPLAMVSEIGRQISGVLEAVHKAGITHRDLKPDNVFLVPDDELASGERVKILDFGIAKLSGAGGGLTATASGSMGTPAYMSPEQWKNSKNVDWRADAYSLGCLAFEMASGQPPFPAETIGEACSKHLTEDPPQLASHVAVPAALDQLIAQLLSKSPDARPPSMREIANRFGALVASSTPLALAATQLSGQVAIPAASSTGTPLPMVPVTAQPVPRNAPTLPSGVVMRMPPEPGLPAPAVAPVTTLGGAAASMQTAQPPKSKALMWTLIGVGGALVVVIVVAAMSLGGGGKRDKDKVDDEVAVGSQPKEVVVPVRPPDPTPAEPPPPLPPPVNGRVSVTSSPIASVAEGTTKLCDKTPCMIELPEGEHSLTLSANGVTQTQSVTVKPRDTISVKVVLAAAGSAVASNQPKRPTEPAKKDPPKEEPKKEPPKVVDEEKPAEAPVGIKCLDEVGCLLAEKPPACCSKFKKGSTRPPNTGGGGSPSGEPDTLDSTAVRSGVGAVRARIVGCGDKFPGAKGTVKLGVKVSPDGSVESVTVKQSPDPGLGSCAARAMQQARFPRSRNGISFTFPFNF